MEWFLVRKVAFEISDNSIQASSSYAGPSVYVLIPYECKIFSYEFTTNYFLFLKIDTNSVSRSQQY